MDCVPVITDGRVCSRFVCAKHALVLVIYAYKKTRKLSYRKDDRAMRPIPGGPKK